MSGLSTLLIVVGVICLGVGIYYLIPNVPHPLASPPNSVHVKHAIAFFAVGVLGIIASRFVRAPAAR
jgi:hypothetical protein